MGLTGFNRSRKQAMASDLKIDYRLADKLMAYGYSHSSQVKQAKEFPFLSKEELKQLKRKPEKKPEPVEVPDVDELDDEFLALPEDTEFPYKIKGGWHYLSNGEKINGKANAEKAQAELDGE